MSLINSNEVIIVYYDLFHYLQSRTATNSTVGNTASGPNVMYSETLPTSSILHAALSFKARIDRLNNLSAPDCQKRVG